MSLIKKFALVFCLMGTIAVAAAAQAPMNGQMANPEATGGGQMKKAEGIAISPEGLLIVLDTGNNRIHRVELTNKLKVKPLAMNSGAGCW